jgi:hypothetical protein
MLKKFTATGIVTVAAAGAMMVATPAIADTNSTSGQGSILGGTQLDLLDLNVPIVVACNGIGVLGTGAGRCGGTGG